MSEFKSLFCVFLGDNGGVLSFSTPEAVGVWAKNEQAAFDFLKAPKGSVLETNVQKQKAAPESIIQALKSAKSEDHLRLMLESVFRSYETGDIIASESMAGKMMTSIASETPMTLGILLSATGKPFPKAEEIFSKKEEVAAFVAGYTAGYPYRLDIKTRRAQTDLPDLTKRMDQMLERVVILEETVNRADETLSALRINVDYAKKKLNETAQQSDDILADVAQTAEEKLAEIIDESVKKIEHQTEVLQEAAKNRMKVKNAVDYWMDMAEMYAMKAAQMTWAFIGVSVLGIVTILGIALALVKAGTGDNAVLVFGVLGLPIFIFVTLLINLAKSRQLSEQNATKAHERFVMVETLVALETEGKAAENERRKIMQDLFVRQEKEK